MSAPLIESPKRPSGAHAALSAAAHPHAPRFERRRRGVFGFAWSFFWGTARLTFAVAVFFGLLAAVSYWAIGRYIRGEEIVTPDLTAKTVSEALETLKRDDLSLIMDREEASEALREGEIISQIPRPGARIKSGSPIRVTVSTGHPAKTIPPELIGQSRLQVGIKLREMELEVGDVSSVPLTGQGNDRALSMDPPAGTGVSPGTKVNLLVSLDQDAQQFLMPNLIGLYPTEARQELERYGLILGVTTERREEGAKPGTVIAQDPVAGVLVAAGAEAQIVVAPEF